MFLALANQCPCVYSSSMIYCERYLFHLEKSFNLHNCSPTVDFRLSNKSDSKMLSTVLVYEHAIWVPRP